MSGIAAPDLLKHTGAVSPRRRRKDELYAIIPRMGVARCSVSFSDVDGLSHRIHVQAESLYEAVALAIAGFRDDPQVPRPSLTTEFTVIIERLVIKHRIRLLPGTFVFDLLRFPVDNVNQNFGPVKRPRVAVLFSVLRFFS
jgi:hypothetical protein